MQLGCGSCADSAGATISHLSASSYCRVLGIGSAQTLHNRVRKAQLGAGATPRTGAAYSTVPAAHVKILATFNEQIR